jgi:hypothetical protein
MEEGVAVTATLVTVGAAVVIAIFVEPAIFTNPATAELAVQVPVVPEPDGVKTPPGVIVPPVAVHVTAGLNTPVPNTVAAQVEVCAVVIEAGVAATEIEVMVNGALVTVIGADPEIFVYPDWVEVAMQLPVPAPDGVNTPEGVIDPPVAAHVTAEL